MSSAPQFQPFNLALIQLGRLGKDKDANLSHAKHMIARAATGDGGLHPNPRLVVLPECFNSLYGHLYFPTYAEIIDFTPGKPYNVAASESQSVQMLSAAAKEHGVWLLGGMPISPTPQSFNMLAYLVSPSGSIPERDKLSGKLYNTATVYSPQGDLVAIHRKVHLFDIDIPGKIKFKESENLSAGNSLNYFDTEFARIGLGICYDVRFPELAMTAARKGCQVLIYPSAFNTTTGPLHWELLQRARAVDNQVFFSMCSPARDLEQDYHAWGHSMVVDPMGKVLAEANHEEAIVFAQIDPKVFEEARAGIPVTTQRRFDVYPDVSKGL